jgi:hypothetical protein
MYYCITVKKVCIIVKKEKKNRMSSFKINTIYTTNVVMFNSVIFYQIKYIFKG